MSSPSSLLAITSALCYYHFPWTASTEVFPLCVFPLHFPHYQNYKEGIWAKMCCPWIIVLFYVTQFSPCLSSFQSGTVGWNFLHLNLYVKTILTDHVLCTSLPWQKFFVMVPTFTLVPLKRWLTERRGRPKMGGDPVPLLSSLAIPNFYFSSY